MLKKIVYIMLITAALAYPCPKGYCAADTAGLFKYESKGKRDPFAPLIGKDRVSSVAGLENITSVQDLNVEGVAVGPGGKNVAIINSQMVKEGDKFGTLKIKKILRKSVEISIEGKNYTIDLQEEGNKVVR